MNERKPDPLARSLRWQLAVIALVAVVAWAVMSRPSGAKADLSDWHTTLADARSAANTSGRPILAYFSADWCGPCQAFKRDTLGEADVMAAVKADFEPAYLDVTDQTSAGIPDAQAMDVQGIPTFMVLDADGRTLARTSGYMAPRRFAMWLTEAQAR